MEDETGQHLVEPCSNRRKQQQLTDDGDHAKQAAVKKIDEFHCERMSVANAWPGKTVSRPHSRSLPPAGANTRTGRCLYTPPAPLLEVADGLHKFLAELLVVLRIDRIKRLGECSVVDLVDLHAGLLHFLNAILFNVVDELTHRHLRCCSSLLESGL